MQLNFLLENEAQNNQFFYNSHISRCIFWPWEGICGQFWTISLLLDTSKDYHTSRDRLYFPTHVWQTKIDHLCKTGQSTHPKKNTLAGFCFCGIPHLFPRKITKGDILRIEIQIRLYMKYKLCSTYGTNQGINKSVVCRRHEVHPARESPKLNRRHGASQVSQYSDHLDHHDEKSLPKKFKPSCW